MLSYYVVWDVIRMALEQILGKVTDSCDDALSFKAEVETTNIVSIVDIEYASVRRKMRFTRMFVALKAYVDGFSEWLHAIFRSGLHYFYRKLEGSIGISFSSRWPQLTFSSNLWCI